MLNWMRVNKGWFYSHTIMPSDSWSWRCQNFLSHLRKLPKNTHNGTRVAVLLFWVSTGKCWVDQCYEICLFGAHVRKAQSTLSPLTGLSRHCPPCLCISCAGVFTWPRGRDWELWLYRCGITSSWKSWQLVRRHTTVFMQHLHTW